MRMGTKKRGEEERPVVNLRGETRRRKRRRGLEKKKGEHKKPSPVSSRKVEQIRQIRRGDRGRKFIPQPAQQGFPVVIIPRH